MKRISPGTVTAGVIAIVFGLVAAYAARHYFDRPPQEPPPAATATIVVPKVNLPQYSRIIDEDLETVEVPVESLPEGAVRLASRALYRLVKTTVMAGQPICETDLYAVGEVPLLADQLPPGYRAVTLQVDANSALNGMIQPESYVDVALTANSKQPALGGLTTLTLIRGVKVLATSQARFPRSEDRPGNLRNITVAVSPKQANKLILAQRYGTLSVTLRSSLEEDIVAQAETDTEAINPNDLLGLVFEPMPEPVVKQAQIWRGGRMQQIFFETPDSPHSSGTGATADGDMPTPAVPVSSGPYGSPGSGCEDCQKKQSTPTPPAAGRVVPGTAAENVPTPAPPESESSLAAGFPQGTRGSVIYIPVEVERGRLEAN